VRVVYQTRWESQEENEDLKREYLEGKGVKFMEQFSLWH
jgi:hypothetical protein